QHEGQHAAAHRLRIDLDGGPLDHAALTQLAYPLVCRTAGQADRLAEVRVGLGGVPLQLGEQYQIDVIHDTDSTTSGRCTLTPNSIWRQRRQGEYSRDRAGEAGRAVRGVRGRLPGRAGHRVQVD